MRKLIIFLISFSVIINVFSMKKDQSKEGDQSKKIEQEVNQEKSVKKEDVVKKLNALIDPNEIPPKGPTGLLEQLGFRYVTFPVKNISEICELLKEKGVTFNVPETELRPGVRIAMVEDPDGNTVEFVQYDE